MNPFERAGGKERTYKAGDLIHLPGIFPGPEPVREERPRRGRTWWKAFRPDIRILALSCLATTSSPVSQFLDSSVKKGTAVLNLQGCYDRVCAIPPGGGRGMQWEYNSC